MSFIIRDNKAARANVDNKLSSTLLKRSPLFVLSFFHYLHITATFEQGFVTRLEGALSDNSCLGIS